MGLSARRNGYCPPALRLIALSLVSSLDSEMVSILSLAVAGGRETAWVCFMARPFILLDTFRVRLRFFPILG